MKTKEFKINVPEGYEIDKENSTFECIKFKHIEEQKWCDDIDKEISGYFISTASDIVQTNGVINDNWNYNVFATQKQAKSALAMARISQIMANDKRFGGAITDEEWNNKTIKKFIITRVGDKYITDYYYNFYCFLAFHKEGQRDLFVKENMDLIKDYLMID